MNLKKPTDEVKEALKKQVVKIRSKWRKLVTGDEKKRIRDHIQDLQEKPKNVKLIDKVGFTLGVLNIMVCQYFLFNIPEYFSVWYAIVIPLLLVSRFYHFKSLNWHYFLFDFCYFSIALSLLNVYFFSYSALFFKICFIFTTGTLPVAIPIWRNSFIFHDFDKIVSVYIHILPCMLYYTLRWKNETGYCLHAQCTDLYLTDYVLALFIYCIWQFSYLMKTEVVDKEKFDKNPELLTSLRWISKDTKNSTARAVLKVLKIIGVFKLDEDFNPTTLKTKLVFVACQLLLTVSSFVPTYFFYYSPNTLLCYIGFVFIVSIFNGASFYIEIFSVRYHSQIEKLEKMHQIVQEASNVATQIETIKSQPQSTKDISIHTKEEHDLTTENKPLNSFSPSDSTLENVKSLSALSSALNETSNEVWQTLKEETDKLESSQFTQSTNETDFFSQEIEYDHEHDLVIDDSDENLSDNEDLDELFFLVDS